MHLLQFIYLTVLLGNNLRENIMHNMTTYIMCEHNNENDLLAGVKPYLNIEDRLEKGFNLHIDESSELMINAKKNYLW